MNHPILISLIALTVAFGIACVYLDGTTLIEFMDGLAAAFFGAVFVTYAPRFFSGLWKKEPDRFDALLVGIAGIGFCGSVQWVVRGVARIMNSAPLYNHPILAYTLLMSSFFAMLHLLVRNAQTGYSPRRSITTDAWALILVTTIVGLAAGFLMISVSRGWLWSAWLFQ